MSLMVSIVALILSIFNFIYSNIIFNKKILARKRVDSNGKTVVEIKNNSNKNVLIKSIVVNDEYLDVIPYKDYMKEEYEKFLKIKAKEFNIKYDKNGEVIKNIIKAFEKKMGSSYPEPQLKNEFNNYLGVNLPTDYSGYIYRIKGYTFILYKDLYKTVLTTDANINFVYIPNNEWKQNAMSVMKVELKMKIGLLTKKKTYYLSPNIL